VVEDEGRWGGKASSEVTVIVAWTIGPRSGFDWRGGRGLFQFLQTWREHGGGRDRMCDQKDGSRG
jgi:hypothetical protein